GNHYPFPMLPFLISPTPFPMPPSPSPPPPSPCSPSPSPCPPSPPPPLPFPIPHFPMLLMAVLDSHPYATMPPFSIPPPAMDFGILCCLSQPNDLCQIFY
ncbi:hypothetical protein V8E53_011354, partial [Lactarius tabidus]